MFLDQSDQLSEVLLAQLASRRNLRSFDKGEMLFHEGQQADALYIVVSGELKVFTQDERGRELVYNVLKSGEFVGELLLDGGRRSASVRAVCASSCVVVAQDDFLDFIRCCPEFVECLVLKLIARLRHATEQLRSVALKDVYERFTGLFNELAVDDGLARVIDKSVTQQEVADRIGASREMVNQIYRELVRGGFLVKDGDRRTVIAKPLPKHW